MSVKFFSAIFITPGLTQKTEEEKREYNKKLEMNRKYIQQYKKRKGIEYDKASSRA